MGREHKENEEIENGIVTWLRYTTNCTHSHNPTAYFLSIYIRIFLCNNKLSGVASAIVYGVEFIYVCCAVVSSKEKSKLGMIFVIKSLMGAYRLLEFIREIEGRGTCGIRDILSNNNRNSFFLLFFFLCR